jgi:Protein of unknown function with HXXEE motif/DAPG hydrolase PhiG domain
VSVQKIQIRVNEMVTGLVVRRSNSQTKDLVIEHELPGVTPEMIDAWWTLMGDTERYKLWHPRDHVWARLEVEEKGGETVIVHHVIEKIGGLPSELRLRMENPDTISIPTEYSHVVAGSSLDRNDVPYAWTQHQYEEMPGGTRMRSTFRIPAKAPGFFVKGLRKHNLEEMGQFSRFLPGLLEQVQRDTGASEDSTARESGSDKGDYMNSEDKSGTVLWALTAASCAHVVEEYIWPGGFLAAAKEVAPDVFAHSSIPIVVGVNASMIIGCTLGALRRKRSPVLGLAMASLLFQNAIIHSVGSLRLKRYMPGLVTGLVLYVPLSVRAFAEYRKSPDYRRSTAVGTAVLGTALHSTPFVAFAIRGALTKGSE